MSLSVTELQHAQKLIDAKSPGTYQLSDIYGYDWASIISPTSFGRYFLRAINEQKLHRIKPIKPRSDNHWEYVIG